MTREILKNNPSTTLSAAVADTVTTSVSVTSGAVFPSTGNFRIIIDSEIMLVTAVATNTLTVVRAQEGTAAATHASAAPVTQILTAGSVKQYLRDNLPGADGSKPPYRLLDKNGNTLTSASFTAVNTTNATITDADDAIILRKATQGAVQDMALLARAYTAPASVIAGFRACLPNSAPSSAFPGLALGFRDSVGGKLNCSFVLNDPNPYWQSLRMLNPTTSDTAGAVKAAVAFTDTLWLKCQDDNTNLIFSISIDGVNWVVVNSEARGAYVTGGPNQFFVGTNNYANGFEILTSLVAWAEG